MKSEFVQITSGRGPAECAWVVAQVLKLFLKEARSMEIKVEVIDKVKGDLNLTLASATVKLTAADQKLTAFVNSWEGSILWIGQSQFRKHHKRKNWFIGLKRVGSASQDSFDPSLVEYQAIRSGGPGGQHVNKVSTAIRASYPPLSLEVKVAESRSQSHNKKVALERLKSMILDRNQSIQLEQIRANWQEHNELERGNPIRVFRGRDFKNESRPSKSSASRKKDKQEWKKNLDKD